MTDSPRIPQDHLLRLRRACAHKFLVDLGGEVRLGRVELLQFLDAYEQIGTLQEKYNELLYAVHSAFPNESRHETALRYIRQREEGDPHQVGKEERR